LAHVREYEEEAKMSASMRPVIVGCCIGLLAVGVFSLRFACTAPDFQEDIRGAELAEMRRDTLTRLEARDKVVRELISQKCTLADAIEQFIKLDPPWPDLLPRVPASQSPQEKNYQYIRFMVEDQLHDDPEQASIVLRRLELEYEKLPAERQTLATTEKNQPSRGH
jgi:hypothetical protein